MKEEKIKLSEGIRIKHLLKSSLLFSLILLLNISNVEASSMELTDLENLFDKNMKSQMKEYHIQNATVSVVSNGEVILQKGYGYANIDNKTLVNPETTMFRIGSTSKLFTWTAVMQLVEQGKIDLDEDINNYLDFLIPQKLERSFSKSKAGPITMRHLMTHTPGFEDAMDGLFYLSQDKTLTLDEYLKKHLPARVFPSGEVMAYSNYGAALAGYVVERVSGIPFSDYIEQNIYKQLEMEHSTFRQPLPDNLSSNMMRPYRFVNGEYLEGEFEFLPEPAGSMSTTASDMANFMISHLQNGYFNGNRILKEETMKKMHSQQFTHNARLGGMTLGFMEGTFNNRRVLSQCGGTMIFNTGLYLLPEENVGIFISFSSGNNRVHAEIFHQFLDRYYPSSLLLDQLPIEGSEKRANKFLGEYHSNRRSFTDSSSVLSLVSGVIQIGMDNSGDLLVTYLGETSRFTELEPGVYHNLRQGRTQDYYGPFKTLVFNTDSFGRTMLMSDGPMTYSKAPWYATSQFTSSALIVDLFIIIVTSVIWIIESILRILKKKEKYDCKIANAGRCAAIAFIIATYILIMAFIITSEMDPVYNMPKITFDAMPLWSNMLDLLPIIMALLSVLILISAVMSWYKNIWDRFTRIHYSIFSIATITLVWIFYYWNIL